MAFASLFPINENVDGECVNNLIKNGAEKISTHQCDITIKHPYLFAIGLALLSIGFLVQLIQLPHHK